jgi:hypothetical protein
MNLTNVARHRSLAGRCAFRSGRHGRVRPRVRGSHPGTPPGHRRDLRPGGGTKSLDINLLLRSGHHHQWGIDHYGADLETAVDDDELILE